MQVLSDAYNSVTTQVSYGLQRLGNTILRLKGDTDSSQKVYQVVLNLILGWNLYKGGTILPKFVVTLGNTVGNHNFLGFLSLPYNWLHDVNVDTIDADALVISLAKISSRLENPPKDDLNKSKGIVKLALEEMASKDIAFRNVNDFKAFLHSKMAKKSDLTNLEVRTHYVPLLTTVTKVLFSVTDVLCIPLYLQEWNLSLANFSYKVMDKVGLGAQAQSIGQTKVFQWGGKQNLTDWAWGLCATGYAFQLLEAARKLLTEKLTVNQKKGAKLTVISSIAEFTLSTASFLRADQKVIIPLSIIVKSIGLYAILNRPEVKVLEKAG